MKKFSPTVPILWGLLLLSGFYIALDFDAHKKGLFGVILVISLFLLPLVVSLYKMKQDLRHEKGKILYKVPLEAARVALVSSTISVVAAVGAVFFNLAHESVFMFGVFWVFLLGPSYILITSVISLLISSFIYLWMKFVDNSTQNQLINNDINIEQTEQKTIEKNTIFLTPQQKVVAVILFSLFIFILLGTDFLHWFLG